MVQAATLADVPPPRTVAPTPTAPPPLQVVPSTPPPATDPAPPRLEIAPYSLPDALTLERELGIGHVLSQENCSVNAPGMRGVMSSVTKITWVIVPILTFGKTIRISNWSS